MTAPNASAEQRAQHRVGATLKDKYRLERVLGVGGMAAVYLAVHRNGLRVAVKVLHPELSIEPQVVTRFAREGYLANSIDHPGAVRVLDDDVAEDGAAYLVMDLLEGETLQHRSKARGGVLPVREVLVLGHQLADTLAAAHHQGIVHRDVKPENLFLTREGVLKVLDFGIARLLDDAGVSLTATGHRMGTPAYMPPEQALGRTGEVDARTDVWACGATIFTLLSGHFVHDCETAGEFVVQTATRPARSIAAVAPEVPAPLVAVVDRALAFAKADRWPSARAMRDALAAAYEALHGAPIGEAAPVRGEGPRLAGNARSPAEPGPATQDPTPPSHEGPIPPTRRDGQPPQMTLRTGPSPTPPSPQPTPPEAPEAELPPATSRPRSRGAAVATLIVTALVAGTSFWAARTAPPPALAARTPPSACAAAAAPACSSNRECAAALGKPAICRRERGACVPLESPECHVVAAREEVDDEATVWFGAMFPTSGPDAPIWGRASEEAVELGRRDFAEISGGLPPARPGGPRRPVGLVACDDAREPRRTAAHLVDEVGVPAILGFARSKEVLDLANDLFLPKGVLALASNTASMLATIPHRPGEPRLVWRTTTSADMVTAPVPLVVSQILEPELRNLKGLLVPGEPIRVALVRVNNTSGLSHADIYAAKLRFNGKSVVENRADFLEVVTEDLATGERLEAEDARAVRRLAEFRPHVVINGDRATIVRDLERAWPAGERFRPRYVTTTIPRAEPYRQLVAERPEARFRLLGIDTRATTPTIAKFVMRHNEVFPTKTSATEGTFAPYDAFYVLAYATVALRDQPITGLALARAIGRLVPPGEPVEVGPGGIYKALAALESGKNVDLAGTTTSLDFDPETGDATADFAVYCLRSGRDAEVIESGVTYDARTKRLEGTLRCP